MKVKGQIVYREDIQIDMEISMTIGELREIVTALNKGKTGFYGAPQRMISQLEQFREKVDAVFVAEDADPSRYAGG